MTALELVILVILSGMSSLVFLSFALLEDKEGFLDKFAGVINALYEDSTENRGYLVKTALSMFLKGILFPFLILFITFMTGCISLHFSLVN